jgi:hypothetical protein
MGLREHCGAAISLLLLALGAGLAAGGVPELPGAKPVPEMQVIPLPYEQASFQYLGRELTRYHFGASLRRPFWFPVMGPEGRSLTRMGHPPAPFGERHHCSLWISHKDVGGVSFWEDDAAGRVVYQRVEEYIDGPTAASMLSTNHWQTADGNVLLRERRRITVYVPAADAPPAPAGGAEHWLMVIDLQLESLPGRPIVLGKTPYGIIGLQVARQMGMADGGGRTLNSAGQMNEPAIRFQPARWVDYSGPLTSQTAAGLTLMDHPANPGHPTPFMARNGGWMGVCPTLNQTLTIQPGKPLRLRYGLWVHAGVAKPEDLARQWEAFARLEAASMVRKP